MKPLLVALALVTLPPLARAQVTIQPGPGGPNVTIGGPREEPDCWRRRREGEREEEWRRRAEFREEEHRREEWQRSHCVRDHGGEEWCRR